MKQLTNNLPIPPIYAMDSGIENIFKSQDVPLQVNIKLVKRIFIVADNIYITALGKMYIMNLWHVVQGYEREIVNFDVPGSNPGVPVIPI